MKARISFDIEVPPGYKPEQEPDDRAWAWFYRNFGLALGGEMLKHAKIEILDQPTSDG